jgi:hypothetical protein
MNSTSACGGTILVKQVATQCVKLCQIVSKHILFRVALSKNACLRQSLQRACAVVELVMAQSPHVMRAVRWRLHATITRACCSSPSTNVITRLPASCGVRFYLQVFALALFGARVHKVEGRGGGHTSQRRKRSQRREGRGKLLSLQNLNAMVVGIAHDDAPVAVDGDAAKWIVELPVAAAFAADGADV